MVGRRGNLTILTINVSLSPVRIRSPQRRNEHWAPVSLSQKTRHHLVTKTDGLRGLLSPRHEGGKTSMHAAMGNSMVITQITTRVNHRNLS